MTAETSLRRGLGAFSLVELLVVVSIIALLVSLLLPSLKRAKESASSAVCSSNLRQMGVAALLYAGEHQSRSMMPGYGGWYTENLGQIVVVDYPRARWLDELWRRLNRNITVLECPSQRTPRPTINYLQYLYGKRLHMPGYQINSQTQGGGLPLRLDQFNPPAKKIWFADSCFYDYSPYQPGQPITEGWAVISCLWIYNWSGGVGPVSRRHFDGSNALFIDGHVAHHRYQELMSVQQGWGEDGLAYRTYWDPDGDGNYLTPVGQ